MSAESVWSKLACFNRSASSVGKKDDGEWMEPVVRRSRKKLSRGGAAREGARTGARRRDVARSDVAGKEPRKPARRRSTVDSEDDESDDDEGVRKEEVDAAFGDVTSGRRDASRSDPPFGERLAMMIILSVFSEEAVLRTAREIGGGSESVAGGASEDEDGGGGAREGGGSADIVVSFVKRDDQNVPDAEEGGMRKVTSSITIDRKTELDGISELSGDFSGVAWDEAREGKATRKTTSSKLIKPKKKNAKKEGRARRATESQVVGAREKLMLLSQFSDAAWC